MLSRFIKDKQQQQIALFLIRAVILYVIWFVSYDFFISPSGKIDHWLNNRVATDAASMLSLAGMPGSTELGNAQVIVKINNVGMVGVGNPCNGLELFVLFAGFIICFPGDLKSKTWFIPLGILGIYLINTLRAAVLAVIQLKAPEHLDFNHHYTFTIIVYSFIFFLWMTWVNKFSAFNAKSKDGKSE